jgi:HTH domain
MKFIYERLKTQRRPNCSALAKALEVSPKTVQRDIDFMRYQLDLPIEYDQARHGFFFNGEVAQFPSVHITEAELVALLVARKALEQYADTPFQRPLAAAFQKLLPASKTRLPLTGKTSKRLSPFVPSDLPNVIWLRSRPSPRPSENGASWSLTIANSKQKSPSGAVFSRCRCSAQRTSGTFALTIGSGPTCGPFTSPGSAIRKC